PAQSGQRPPGSPPGVCVCVCRASVYRCVCVLTHTRCSVSESAQGDRTSSRAPCAVRPAAARFSPRCVCVCVSCKCLSVCLCSYTHKMLCLRECSRRSDELPSSVRSQASGRQVLPQVCVCVCVVQVFIGVFVFLHTQDALSQRVLK